MNLSRFFTLGLLGLLFLASCGDDDDTLTATGPRTFELTITNVSTPNTVMTDRADGTVPLSPPVVAIFTGADPMFVEGDSANIGTERIAEDGFPDEMLSLLQNATNVKSQGAAPSPGGPDNGPALFAGEGVTITFDAEPGDLLQMETMFVQSNDWFYAFSGGPVELFDGNTPLTGDLTGRLAVYDAGTEADTAPGTGEFQKPVQDADAEDVGPDENEVIRLASQRHPNFTIPANSAVISVTISVQ